MNAIQQKCRPKHQVLVLKCYPRTTKGAVDVKPNSSELSYLLFYAQSRRSKIPKVCGFLEKKTASDVYRLRIGNVQVTLQILAAMIEKMPKDLPLYANYILRILDQVLRSNDITMVESSIPTFEAFCEHHDASSLFADQSYLRQYEGVVRQYAALASTRSFPGKVQPSKPVAMRWRNTGLEAIRSVASSDALSSVTGRQYNVIVPMILENLWTDNEDFLEVLLQRAHMEEKVESGAMLRRRTSIATVRTVDTAGDTNPIALSGAAADVDKLAEEDIGVLAMQCLKQIFVVPVRSQIHGATVALLKFIEERVNQQEVVVKSAGNGKDSGWAIKMVGLVSRWAPVQDRFLILVTAMDTMTKTPLADATLQQHITLAAMVGSLLRSDVNFIGLSVMDVLLQLLAHMRRLVQLPGDPNAMKSEPLLPGRPDPRSPTTIYNAEKAEGIAQQRKELLVRLQHCIGDLATHVYYADQISDMISAIMAKLKPSRSSSTANSSPPGEKTDAAVSAGDDQHLDSLFSLTVAKTAALRAVKAVLLVANPRTKMTGNANLSRNRVPIQVWEGTQWLLGDPDGQVRKAYADALLTWLDRETTKVDLNAREDASSEQRSALKSSRDFPPATVARRAVSSASNREKSTKVLRSHFLQLLHLAIYDNAIQYIEYETDIVLLHVLLAKLVTQLGINAVRCGIPMVFRLQEDIQDAETPLHKVRLGSLCHGYFWILTEKFDFEASVVGRAIHNEIIRRRSKNFWVEGIHIPPPLLELVGTPGVARPQPKMPTREVESEALLPFDDRISLVECICTSYQESTVSPPASPAASPNRSFTHPVLSATLSTIPTSSSDKEVPNYFREQMLMDWSREAVLASAAAGSKSASLAGSKTGTTGTNRHRLAANGGAVGNGQLQANGLAASPHGSKVNLRPASSPNAGANLAPGGGANLRKTSVRSNVSRTPGSVTSSRGAGVAVTSVDQLKLALSGDLQTPRTGLKTSHTLGLLDDDSSTDSMVSYDVTPSEVSFNPAAAATTTIVEPSAVPIRSGSRDGHEHATYSSRPSSRDRRVSLTGGPLGSNPVHDTVSEEEETAGDDTEDDVPPVPPLPSGLEGHVVVPTQDSGSRPGTAKLRNLKSRGGDSVLSGSWSNANNNGNGANAGAAASKRIEEPVAAMDLDSLLKGIDSRGTESGIGSLSRPPY